MKLSFRHILLLIGITSVILSFLFFGRNQNLYSILLIGGLIVASFAFIIIVFKDRKRQKLIWIGVVILAFCIQRLTEQILIKQSYKSLIGKHQDLFLEVNKIFINKPGEVWFLKDAQQDSTKTFSIDETTAINQLFEKTDIHLIKKDSSKIFYETYGMLGVRLGIFYFYASINPNNRFKLIKQRWYYIISAFVILCTLVQRRKEKNYAAAEQREFYFRHFGNA